MDFHILIAVLLHMHESPLSFCTKIDTYILTISLLISLKWTSFNMEKISQPYIITSFLSTNPFNSVGILLYLNKYSILLYVITKEI